MQHSAVLFRMLHTQQLHAGQSQIIGTEGGTGGEYTHSGIAAQTGRAHRGRPALTNSLGKLPDDPQMGEILNTPQGIGIAEFRLKNDGGAQFVHQTALAGDAEFCGKIAVHTGDHLNIHIHIKPSLFGSRRSLRRSAQGSG